MQGLGGALESLGLALLQLTLGTVDTKATHENEDFPRLRHTPRQESPSQAAEAPPIDSL